MQFVHPTFLWALLFVAIPIIIHLFYFRRYKRVLFSNTQFLNEIKEERSSRNRLRHLLVLLTRILAIVFLVLAFAQPFIPTHKQQIQGKKMVSIYLDNSFSMNAEGNGRLLFDEAKEMAERIILAYSDNNDFQILSNDFEGKHQRLVTKTEALNLLKEIQVSPAAQSSKTAFERQNNLLYREEGSKIIYHISDFQRALPLLENNEEYAINLLPITPTNVRNVYFDSLWFDAPIQLKDQANKLVVKIANESNEQVSGTYNMVLNGQSKAVSEYTIDANTYTVDTLHFTIIDTGWNQGELILNDYPITFDDDYYFSFYVENEVNVLTISEDKEDKIFNAVFQGLDNVNYISEKTTSVDYNSLNEKHLVVLNQLKSIPSGLTESLKDYVAQGGNVFVAPTNDLSLESYNQFLASFEIGRFSGVNEANRTASVMNTQHQVLFDLFDEIPQNMKLPAVQRHFYLEKNTFSQQENLFSFSNGDALLSSFRYKQGDVYVLATPLDKNYSDFSTSPVFAPIIYKMAVLGVKNANIAFEINTNTAIKLNQSPQNNEAIIKLSNEISEIIPQKMNYDGSTVLNAKGQQLISGFYEAKIENDDFYALVALNYNRLESTLDYYSFEELTDYYTGGNVQVLGNNIAEISENVSLQEQGKSFWKWCIILALVFLALEIVLLRLLPK